MDAALAVTLRRLGSALLVVLGACTLTFFLVHLSGDPLATLLPPDTSEDARQQLRRAYGLDEPLPSQYVRHLGRAIRGDFGTSIRYDEPALGLVLQRLPVTLELTGTALLLAIGTAAVVASISVRASAPVNLLLRSLIALGQALPSFWVGTLLISCFAVSWGILPSSGRSGPSALVLPAITLSLYSAALLSRALTTSLRQAYRSDYIRAARGKGLSERALIQGHALRNAVIPVLTLLGVQASTLLGGAIIVESVFGYPGMGLLVVQAVLNHDVPLVQAVVVVSATLVLAISQTLDLMYALIDPRIRYR